MIFMLRNGRLLLPVLTLVVLCACGKKESASGPVASRGDALFLAEAPALVPDELEPDLDAMGIRRIYVPGATLSASGAIAAVTPPPPNPIRRPVVFTVLGEPGAEGLLAPGAKGELVGEAWAGALGKLVAEARSWAQVEGVHIHILPRPESAEALAAALTALKRALGGKLGVSVTVPSDAPPGAWQPLVGAADELLVFALGRRPETRDEFVRTIGADAARAMPVPFRILVVPGGYGRGGADGSGRRIPDGQIDRLSEDRGLDFEFSGVLSNDPGTVATFKPRPAVSPSTTLLAEDGGRAVFKYLTAIDLTQYLSEVSRWAAPNLRGRVFAVDGLPKDGHLVGFEAIRAILTSKPWEPSLKIEVVPQPSAPGSVSFTLQVSNEGPTATDLSHVNGYVAVRAQGGVVVDVQTGDFDRFELLAPEGDQLRPAPFSRATVCRLFENVFVPGERNVAGPVRIAGPHPQVAVGYKITLPGGREIVSEPAPVQVVPPTPTPRPKPAKKRK